MSALPVCTGCTLRHKLWGGQHSHQGQTRCWHAAALSAEHLDSVAAGQAPEKTPSGLSSSSAAEPTSAARPASITSTRSASAPAQHQQQHLADQQRHEHCMNVSTISISSSSTNTLSAAIHLHQ